MSKMRVKKPGKCHREGVSIVQLMDQIFPDEAAAEAWFEGQRWREGICCPDCDSFRFSEVKHKTMKYRCKDCRRYFSVKKGTAMASSNLPLRYWAICIYLMATNLKGVSSMRISRELGIRQSSAWHMMQRIRTGFEDGIDMLRGEVEMDEMFVGGKRKNMHASKRKKLKGRGTVGKVAVVGIKGRETKKVTAAPIKRTDGETLASFAEHNVLPGSTVYTDDAGAYNALARKFEHDSVKHSVGEYVKGIDVHTNGIESFWSMFKRGYVGTYHKMSVKHLFRYVNEFTGRHNIRDMDTLDQMAFIARGMIGKQLRYKDLIADA